MGSKLALLAVYPAVLLASSGPGRVAKAIPEPTDLALFAFGITGLLIGRHMAKKRKDDDRD